MFFHLRKLGSAGRHSALAFCLALVVLGIDAAGQATPGFSTVLGRPDHQPSLSKAVVQPDGRILIAGAFYDVDFQERSGMARLLSNGSVDPSFDPAVQVQDFVLMPDGKLVVYDVSGSNRLIRRLNSDGSIDGSFTPVTFSNGSSPGTIRVMALAADGKIYIGGDFTVIGGVARRMLARLNADGTVDETFADVNPSASTPGSQLLSILALQPRADGKVFVGGYFHNIAGVTRPGIVLLNNNGTADTTFDAGRTEEQFVNGITEVEDGKVMISGGTSAKRVFANGSVDPSFAPPVFVMGCVPQVAGKYVCASTASEDVDFPLAVRVNAADGSIDTTFSTIGVRGRGNFLVLPDGKILAYGNYWPDQSKARKWPRALARLHVNGALDEPASARSDFDGDLRTDISVFRPSTGQWFVRSQSGWYSVVNWGMATDQIVPADYDGDAVTDYAVFRGANSNWYIINSSDNTITVNSWGQEGDVPLAADYDNDRKAERVIYRPSESKLYVLSTKYGIQPARTAGLTGDKPLVGDFDGDNIADSVFYRPSSGHWLLQMTTNPTFVIRQWGQPGDIPVPADYDGDRVTDFAIYRPSTGEWWHRTSSSPLSFIVRQWGEPGDIPVPGDYDGDRVADRAIFRPSTNTWHILGSQAGWERFQFGEAGDIPTPGVF